MTFIPPGAKISIGSLDEAGISVDAQYNPKELQIDKSVPWQKHNKANANGLQLEFTGAEGRTMSIDLLFDGYEENASIQESAPKRILSFGSSRERRTTPKRASVPPM